MPPTEPPGLTAFPRTELFLRRTLAAAPIHFASLERPLRRCDLQQCKGMCCYDGIYLSLDEADVIAQLARSEEGFFRELGLHLPRKVVVQDSWEGLVSGKKTAVAPWPAGPGVAGFPSHFHATACVFHLPDGRCGLQMLSEARGLHRWHFKPTGCWLHPLTSLYTDGPGLGLHDAATDPCRMPHYAGFIAQTHCGRTAEQGQPAYEVLRDELDFLGRIVGRDLVAEVADRAGSEQGRRQALKVLPDER